MNCACIKGIFDLHVSSGDCRNMVIEDQSLWMIGTGFSAAQPYEVTVVNPAFNSNVTLTINPDKRNVFTTVDLLDSKTPECISDGIYCFKTESCDKKYTINKAYLCNSRCKIDTLISHNIDVQEVEYLFRSVEINVKLNRLLIASEIFDILQNKLKILGCDKFKCCG